MMRLYGMDIEIARKMAAKRNPEMEQQAQEWIEAILEELAPKNISFEDSLKDGVRLCRVMNVIKPNAIPTINRRASAFACRENIQAFQLAAQAYGVPDAELFHPMDLYEKKNIAQVTLSLFALSRQSVKMGFNGPRLCHKRVYVPCDKQDEHNRSPASSIKQNSDPVQCTQKVINDIPDLNHTLKGNTGRVLIELTQRPNLSKDELKEVLNKYTEAKIGRVEQKTLKEIIQDHSAELKVDEAPLSDYAEILPELFCLILLEND